MEAVFDLIQDGKKYFDPYRGLYKLDNLDLVNYSLLTRLIGLQKFEKKGANSGGDGGAGFDHAQREQVRGLLEPFGDRGQEWTGSSFLELPDNLTGWRVLPSPPPPATGWASGLPNSKSSKLTELRPVLPNQLTSGRPVYRRLQRAEPLRQDAHHRCRLEGQ